MHREVKNRQTYTQALRYGRKGGREAKREDVMTKKCGKGEKRRNRDEIQMIFMESE